MKENYSKEFNETKNLNTQTEEVRQKEIESLNELNVSIDRLDGLLTGFADLSTTQKVIYEKNPYKKYVGGLQLRLNIIRSYIIRKMEDRHNKFLSIDMPIEKINNDIKTIIRDLNFDFMFLGLKTDENDIFEKMNEKNIKKDQDLINKLEIIKNGPSEHPNFKTFQELEERLSYLDPIIKEIENSQKS